MKNRQDVRKLEFVECSIGERRLLLVGPAFATSVPNSDVGQQDWLTHDKLVIANMAKSAMNFNSLIGFISFIYFKIIIRRRFK